MKGHKQHLYLEVCSLSILSLFPCHFFLLKNMYLISCGLSTLSSDKNVKHKKFLDIKKTHTYTKKTWVVGAKNMNSEKQKQKQNVIKYTKQMFNLSNKETKSTILTGQ